MTLTELRYIVALHQTAHFGKAAEKCFVSQPTLSIAIKRLEQELDVSIFERSRNQVHVTPIGQKIVQQAQIVLEQTDIINELANSGKDALGSTLSIGAIFTVGPYLFPRFVTHLQKAAPNMPLYIEENYTSVLCEKLRNGELDVIIIALPFDEPDIVLQQLYEEPLVVLLHTNHPLCKLDQITDRHIENEKVLLLGEGHCFRDQVLQACPSLNNKNKLSKNMDNFQSVIEGSSLETLKYMVASKLGITVLPQSATQWDHYDGSTLTTRPLVTPLSTRTIALAWRASFPRQKAIEILSQSIRNNQPTPHQ